MRHDLDTLKIALEGAPFVRVEGELARVVPFLDLTQCMPPNWLYTSGRANRYNPAGIDCLYLSDSTKVAQAEYENVWQGTNTSR